MSIANHSDLECHVPLGDANRACKSRSERGRLPDCSAGRSIVERCSKCIALEAENISQRTEIAALKSELEVAKAELVSALSENAELEKECESLTARIAQLEADCESLFFRSLKSETKNAELMEKLGIRERQLGERVDELHGPKADRIPNDSVQDELDLNSDDVLDSLTELVKDRIKEELGKFNYGGSEDSAAGGQQDHDFGNQIKADIPEVEKRLDPEQFCTKSGCEGEMLVHISDDRHRVLRKHPNPYYWETTLRGKYKCPCCGEIYEMPPPHSPFPKVRLGTEIIVESAINKVLMGLPIYRQSKLLMWMGQRISRRTLDRLFHALADILRPVHEVMRVKVIGRPMVFADDTTHKINLPEKPGILTQGHLWFYYAFDGASGGTGSRLIYIEATPDWKADHPRELLKGFEGLLHTDCYKGWLSIFHESEGRFALQLCWAHARRRFVKVLKKKSGATEQEIEIALQILLLIRKMFGIERRIRDWTPEARLEARKRGSEALVHSIRFLIDKHRPELKDSSCLADAMDYLGGNNWELFLTFLSNGKASLTTNLVEGKIRTAATGRKNYGHSKSLKGAEDLAIIMSVVMSAIENGLNPLVYVPDVVEKIPHTPEDQLYTLSPDEYKKHYGGDGNEPPKPGGGKHIGSDENLNVTDNAASAVANEQTSDGNADSENHQETDDQDTGSSGGTNSQQKMQPDPDPNLPASVKENVDHRVISSAEDGNIINQNARHQATGLCTALHLLFTCACSLWNRILHLPNHCMRMFSIQSNAGASLWNSFKGSQVECAMHKVCGKIRLINGNRDPPAFNSQHMQCAGFTLAG